MPSRSEEIAKRLADEALEMDDFGNTKWRPDVAAAILAEYSQPPVFTSIVMLVKDPTQINGWLSFDPSIPEGELWIQDSEDRHLIAKINGTGERTPLALPQCDI